MGIRCELNKVLDFTYQAQLDNHLTEYEYDHVFVGYFDGPVCPHPEEAHAWKWMKRDALLKDIHDHPQQYTVWFKLILENVLNVVFPTSQV
jgi:isopentenyl-diphosphate delta-isomerase